MNLPAYIILCVVSNGLGLCKSVNRLQSMDSSPKHTQNFCNKYFLVPDDMKADLSSAKGLCSTNLIGFGILGDLMGLTGMCYKITYTNYICRTSHSLTIRAWHMIVRWNGTETFLSKKETTPLFQKTVTCRDVQSPKYYSFCREYVHMIELSINNNSTEAIDYMIETSNATSSEIQGDINPRYIDRLIVVTKSCICTERMCGSCKPEQHKVSTDFIDSLINRPRTSNIQIDMNNVINVIGGIVGGVLTSFAGVAFKLCFEKMVKNGKKGYREQKKDTGTEDLAKDTGTEVEKNDTEIKPDKDEKEGLLADETNKLKNPDPT